MVDVHHGLEGVVAFETEIAEPDKEGSALRYRGVDIEELVGAVPFEKVWGLLVDGSFDPGLPPAEPWPLTVRSGDARVDVQSALAMLAPEWGFQQLIDISDEECRDNLARASVMALSFVGQSARGSGRRARSSSSAAFSSAAATSYRGAPSCSAVLRSTRARGSSARYTRCPKPISRSPRSSTLRTYADASPSSSTPSSM